jgi:RNA polymerase sigma-70 factor (ECF subfamily)
VTGQGETLEALMERYVDGDRAAFEALYTALRPAILGTLRRWLRVEAAVEDAFQTTILKLHLSRERYRRGASVLPWVVTIARNVARDHLRLKANREQPLEEGAEQLIAAEGESQWSSEDEREVIQAVREAIESLPAGTRAVVQLHKLEGKSMAEVASALGINEGAARVRAHRGYKALAQRLLRLRATRD